MSPTARSLKLLRDRGYVAEVVEKTIPKTFIKKDLWGFVDIVAIRGTETVGVQTTDHTHVAMRLAKIEQSDLLQAVLDAGWTVVVHGWRKVGHRWQCREEFVT